MGKSSPKPPPAPDPTELAREQAQFNRINQVTPFGSLTFSGPDRNTATLEFSPELSAVFDQRGQLDSQLLGQALTRMGILDPNPISLDQFGPIRTNAGLQQFTPDLSGLPAIPQDFGALRNEIEDAFFNRSARLLRPEFQRQEESLIQRLANQGLPQTDEAFQEQAEIFGENRNRAFQDLANQAVLFGGQEASRELGNVLAGRSGLLQEQGFRQGATGFNNAVLQQILQNANAGRTQGLSEAMALRGNQFNELAALLGLQQVQPPGLQNFFQPGQVDTLGANQLSLNQANLGFQADLQRQQAALGGLFGLGSALITGGAFSPGGIPGIFGLGGG